MPNYLPSNGHKSFLQLLIKPTLDSFGWGGPINTAPEVKTCGGGTTDYSLGRRRHTRKLSIFYALCWGCRGVIGNILLGAGRCEQCLSGVSPGKAALIWCGFDGGSSYVKARIWALNGFGPKQEWHSKFGGVHGELRKVRVGLRAYVRQQEENHLRKKGEKLSSSARATSGKNTFCHINESFVSAGWMCEGQVTVINEETPRDQPIWVWSCPPEFELGNWQVIKQPGISMANSM